MAGTCCLPQRTAIAVLLAVGSSGLHAQSNFSGLSRYPGLHPEVPGVSGTWPKLFGLTGASDLDADGRTDLLVSTLNSFASGSYLQSLRVWRSIDDQANLVQGAQSSWTSAQQLAWSNPLIEDLTGDGLPDLAVVDSVADRVLLLRNLGAGQFALPEIFAMPSTNSPHYVLAGDTDGDGLAEALVWDSSGLFHWRWDGSKFEQLPILPPVPDVSAADLCVVMDWNSDAFDDWIMAGVDGVLVYFGAPAGLSATLAGPFGGYQSNPFLPYDALSGDLDGDGADDLLVLGAAAGGAYATFWGVPSGGLPIFGGSVPQNLGLSQPLAGDWDVDGDLDLLSGRYDTLTSVAVRENQGGRSFAPPVVLGGPAVGVALGLSDVDGDGRQDLVTQEGVLFSNGAIQPLISKQISPARRIALDREGDGDLDRIEVSSIAPKLSLNDGSGDFLVYGAVALPAAPAGFSYRNHSAIADFTGDGRVDFLCTYTQKLGPVLWGFVSTALLVDDGVGGYVAWPNVGSANIAPSSSLGDAKLPLLSADLDQDGDLDVIGLGNKLWLNKGTPTTPFFDTPTVLFPDPVEALADVNGDGRVDLVTREAGTPSKLRLQANLGNLQFQAADLLWHNDMQPRPIFRDLDGDGDLDLAVSTNSSPSDSARLFLMPNEGGFFPTTIVLDASNFGMVQSMEVDDVDRDGHLDLVLGRETDVLPITDVQVAVLYGSAQPFGYLRLGAWDLGLNSGLADWDGDGDLDLFNSIGMQRGRGFEGPEDGSIRQYGQGFAGTGGAKPVLGASGPMRLGSKTAAWRIVGGNGAAPAIFAVASASDAVPEFPAPGMNLLVQASSAVLYPLVLSGSGAGSGEALFPIDSSASIAGLSFYGQVFCLDFGSPTWLSQSNGLELVYGF